MLYSEAKPGRVFVIRLEHGDILHQEIEKFARAQSIRAAALTVVGAADAGSVLVVGPERGDQRPIVPTTCVLDNIHEVTGTGTLFWDDETAEPLLHMHIACGRDGKTRAGCVRNGVRVWQLMEIVLWELLDTSAHRVLDAELGFKVLIP